jgi:hypothetical protein
VLLLWSLARLGYDPRALPTQIISGTLLMILSYALTSPAANINWVFAPGSKRLQWLPPLAYVTMVIVSFPLFVYWPTHLALMRLFPIAP